MPLHALGGSAMPAKADPKVMEAVELVLAGDDASTALAKVGLEICPWQDGM